MRRILLAGLLLAAPMAHAQAPPPEQQQIAEADLKFRLGQALQNEARLTMQVINAQKHEADLTKWFAEYFKVESPK